MLEPGCHLVNTWVRIWRTWKVNIRSSLLSWIVLLRRADQVDPSTSTPGIAQYAATIAIGHSTGNSNYLRRIFDHVTFVERYNHMSDTDKIGEDTQLAATWASSVSSTDAVTDSGSPQDQNNEAESDG